MPDGGFAGAAERLRDLVKNYEGFARVVRLRPVPMARPYVCPAGYWTIGYGHVCDPAAPEIEEPAACRLLDADLAIAGQGVRRLVTYPLAPLQFAALTSWTFNLGQARLRASTLRQVINRGELDAVPGQFRRWVYAGARVLPGLVARREAEVALWLAT